MKRTLLPWLVCPIDHLELSLEIFKEESVQLATEMAFELEHRGISLHDMQTEIVHGLLINHRLRVIFPIYRGIPRMLVFPHPLLEIFKQEFKIECEAYSLRGYRFSNDQSVPGESSVFDSFSKEWTDYGFNRDAYWGQTAEAYNDSLFETLRNEQDLSDKMVLEVGIGSGGSANEMTSRFNSSLIGVDLGYSVDVAYDHFGTNPFLHIVQASAFKLPFRDNVFDFVYSHGVIHHTYDTRIAFDQLAKLPKPGGRLYVWVYSFRNEQRSLKRRIIMLLERLIRPWCSLLPTALQTMVLILIAPLYIFHQNTLQLKTGKGFTRYRWREAMHAARDRFTPKYIHRHSEDEVIHWFYVNGYNKVRPLSKKKLADFVPVGFYMNTGVEGFKA